MTKQDLTSRAALLANAFELVNVSVRLHAIHKDMVERAAEKMGHETPSDYIRDVLSYQAALDLNEDLPVVPEVHRGRGGSLIAQAAAKLGMSREDFEKQAIQMAAAQALGANAIDDRPSSPPARPGSGTYSRTALPSERPLAVKRGR